MPLVPTWDFGLIATRLARRNGWKRITHPTGSCLAVSVLSGMSPVSHTRLPSPARRAQLFFANDAAGIQLALSPPRRSRRRSPDSAYSTSHRLPTFRFGFTALSSLQDRDPAPATPHLHPRACSLQTFFVGNQHTVNPPTRLLSGVGPKTHGSG